ncbi:hypothetical protein M3484_01835 [Pseudomonas sp. GX19020]|uniref:hypothetical protein n=1 Tax=Pseudomonas sp. GX19020 TaxID=2942277 RepID=UPI0020194C22|nr:hypothetical protein [Pseudomonas sp. GX19020]MCL4065316.1 hypothetical protein [Pseudomonas sp. GX19020]
MNWPDWLSEARLALIISTMSFLAASVAAFFTWRQSAHAKAALKRKELAIAPYITRKPTDDGLRYVRISIRNLEPHEARLTEIRSKKRATLIKMDPRKHQISSENDFGRERPVNIRVMPSPDQAAGGMAVYLIANAELETKDLEFSWHWVDGTKR